MEIKRCYPTLVGASVAENQLCNGESVTVPNGHKYYMKKSEVESLGASAGTAITGLTSGSDMVIDLTQMLGSTIADYAYTLEQATAGSGIAWLRSYDLIPDEYKPYNTGTIESVEATAKVVRDENGENDINYPLGSDVLRGVFKLDANNKLYADGDRKEADGTITRKYAYVNLGSLNWAKSSSGSKFYASVNPVYPTRDNLVMVCSAYAFDGVGNSAYGYYGANKTIRYFWAPSSESKEFYVVDESYSDAVSFMNAVSGQYIVYELATPTTEQSTPFTSPQICYPDGTEEFVTENGVPVGHESKYQL